MSGLRPLEVGEAVRFSWVVYKDRFGTLLAISLVLVGVPSLMQWLPGVGLLMSIVLLFAELLATGAFIRVAASHCVDLHPSSGDAIKEAGARYRKMLSMGVCYSLGVAAVAIVMIMIGTIILAFLAFGMLEEVSSYAEDPFSMPSGTLFRFLAWTFVMVLPAIGLAILWWVAPMAVMVEGTGGIASLIRSWRLVMPHLWRTTKVLLLSLAVVVLPFVVLYWLFPYYLAALIISVLVLPFTSVIGTVLYLDLRSRSENLDPETLAYELT